LNEKVKGLALGGNPNEKRRESHLDGNREVTFVESEEICRVGTPCTVKKKKKSRGTRGLLKEGERLRKSNVQPPLVTF